MRSTYDPNTGKYIYHDDSEPKPEPVPEPIAVKLAELYAEYVKPERFFQWVFEQEQLKRNLAKQQLELQLQREYARACLEVEQFRDRWNGQPEPDGDSNK
jgi:hypothetical protein